MSRPLLLIPLAGLLAGCPPRTAVRDATAPPADPGTALAAASAAKGPVVRPRADGKWLFPLAGGAMPRETNLLPNASRGYRGGVHEGVDLFTVADGAAVPCAAPVQNARDGWVIRADHAWRAMAGREYDVLTGALKNGPDADMLDRLRGRQVWVRDADGFIVRYCHLQAVAPDITVGLKIERGTRIGLVGNSGTADGAHNTGTNCHLHFEIRLADGRFLGQDENPRTAGELYEALFAPPSP